MNFLLLDRRVSSFHSYPQLLRVLSTRFQFLAVARFSLARITQCYRMQMYSFAFTTRLYDAVPLQQMILYTSVMLSHQSHNVSDALSDLSNGMTISSRVRSCKTRGQ